MLNDWISEVFWHSKQCFRHVFKTQTVFFMLLVGCLFVSILLILFFCLYWPNVLPASLTVLTTGVKILRIFFESDEYLRSLTECISFCFLRNWLLIPLNSTVCVWYSSCRICRCWKWWNHRKFLKGWKLTSSKFFSNKHQALILCSWFAIVIPHLGCPTRAHSDTDL